MTYSAIEDNYEPTKYALVNILSFGWTANLVSRIHQRYGKHYFLIFFFNGLLISQPLENLKMKLLQLCNTLYDEAIKNDISDLKD